MKNKLVITLISALAVTPLFSCANNNQPLSNYYAINVVNTSKSLDLEPQIEFVNSHLIKKGEDCNLLIRFPKYAEAKPLENQSYNYELRRAQFDEAGKVLDRNLYTFTPNTGDPCLYKLSIPQKYMNCSYDLFINLDWMESHYNESTILLDNNLARDAYVQMISTRVNRDLYFNIIPKNYQAGVTFTQDIASKIKINGYKNGILIEPLTKENGGISEYLMPRLYSNVQGYTSFSTNSSGLYIGIPMDALYEENPTTFLGYNPKFDQIVISLEEGEGLDYQSDYFKNEIFDITNEDDSCLLTNEEWKLNESDGHIHYTLDFVSQNGHLFPTPYYFSSTNFPITSISSISVTSPYKAFRDFIVNESSEEKTIMQKPYTAYYGDEDLLGIASGYFTDQLGNYYKSINSWMKLTVTGSGSKLTIDIDINEFVRLSQFPSNSILSYLTIDDYYGGSVDFINNVSIKVKAKI